MGSVASSAKLLAKRLNPFKNDLGSIYWLGKTFRRTLLINLESARIRLWSTFHRGASHWILLCWVMCHTNSLRSRLWKRASHVSPCALAMTMKFTTLATANLCVTLSSSPWDMEPVWVRAYFCYFGLKARFNLYTNTIKVLKRT